MPAGRPLPATSCALRLASAFVLNFLRGLRSFETPVLQGTPGNIKVFVSRVYDSMALEFNTGLATAYSVVLVVLSVITLYFYVRATRFSERYATITGKGYRVKVIDIGPWKYITFLAVLFYFLVGIAIPFLVISGVMLDRLRTADFGFPTDGESFTPTRYSIRNTEPDNR